MSIVTPSGEVVWGDFNSFGIPSSGAKEPKKTEIRAWSSSIELLLDTVASSAAVFDTRTSLFSVLTYAANTLAWVVSDPIVAYNGIYRKSGVSGSGSWSRIGDLPYSFVKLTDTGAGSPNAIHLASSIPTSASVLRIANVFEPNSGNVTISENDETEKPLLTSSGNQIAAGGLVTGMTIAYVDAGASFRLLTDQASSAIQAAAEAAQAAAEAAAEAAADYADFAHNNWVLAARFTGTGEQEDYPLSIDPGSENNMLVSVGGVDQPPGGDNPPWLLVYDGADAFIRINVPIEVQGVVRIGNAVDVGVPSDGSVTESKIGTGAVSTSKIADNAVTFSKLQDIDTLRLLGRVTAGSGDPEALTAAQLRDLFLPAGGMVDSTTGIYALNADLSTPIPIDDTIPQITEGTQIISVTITPKSISNKLRLRFTGQITSATATSAAIAMFVNGAANAVAAELVAISNVSQAYTVSFEYEFLPGSVSEQTITVRAGAPAAIRFNGSGTARFLGGASAARLVVEEIKG